MISIIIPVIEYNEALFDATINSVKAQQEDWDGSMQVIIATANEMDIPSEKLQGFEQFKISGDSSIQNFVNESVANLVSQQYFAVLKVGDEIVQGYLKKAFDGYIMKHQEPSCYMNIVYEVDVENNFVGMYNDASWHNGVVSRVGHYTFEEMSKRKQLLSPAFVIYKTMEYVELGSLKKNIELFYELELIYRMARQGHTVFVIPRMGVKSLQSNWLRLDGSKNITDITSIRFWLNTIINESAFDIDRKIDKTDLLELKDKSNFEEPEAIV